jgi:threonyl-tRNA synthetase
LSALKKQNAIAIKYGSQLLDINAVYEIAASEIASFEIEKSAIIPIGLDSPEGLDIYRHSVSHVMAHAVKELFPDVKYSIGPTIAEGFYYDFDVLTPFSSDDLTNITKKMKEIIKRNSPFVRKTISKSDAITLFEKLGQPYKMELINDIKDENVSIYEEGGFVDLCRGPHLSSTGKVKAFALLKTAGAYWRGDEKNKMLERIYGTAFATKEDLDKYLQFLEEVKNRDHRKLGKELDLFSINDEIGSGLVLWHPKGATIRLAIEDFWRAEHIKADYNILYTPHMAKLELWERSGHWGFYRDNMYSPMGIDEVDYEIKPMNCPFHIAVYKDSLRSYRDLPIRYAELGTVYRYERSGVLHGLMRVRGFTQDDAHIFCRTDQIEHEIENVLDFTLFVLKTFGFDSYDIYLSTRPDKYVGSLENWDIATSALERALKVKGINYELDPGEGVFYGPKIDIKVKDILGRKWQCSTIQVDFNLPERFNITYRGSDDNEHMPIMIHRALMGSLERFFGILIEHYNGAFPLWLSPVQVSVMTIAERHIEYASKIAGILKEKGIRVELETDNEKIGYKIRQSTMKKIPFSIIIGDKEIETGSMAIRRRDGENTDSFTIDGIAEYLLNKIKTKE